MKCSRGGNTSGGGGFCHLESPGLDTNNAVYTESSGLHTKGGIVGKPYTVSAIAEPELTRGQAHRGDPIAANGSGHRKFAISPLIEVPRQEYLLGIRPAEPEFHPIASDAYHLKFLTYKSLGPVHLAD